MTVPEYTPTLKVKVVDMALPKEELVAELRDAFANGGFCYVVNHGVPAKQMSAAFATANKFFALPREEREKVRAGQNGNFRGYTGIPQVLASGTQPDTVESFYFTSQFEPGSEEARKLEWGKNHNIWPEAMPELREVVTSWHSACSEVGWKLLPLLALAMGLPEGTFRDYYDHPHVYGRFNHYSAQKSAPERGLFGAGQHTDYGVMTALATDSEPGLEVFQDGVWYAAPPMPGAFIILLGDVMERWTNGKYPGTLHRVVNTTGNERTSAVVWFDCNLDSVVEPLPQFVSAEEPPKYPTTVYRKHLTDLFYKIFPDWREGMTEVDAGRVAVAAH